MTGHISRECPNPPQEGAGASDNTQCYKVSLNAGQYVGGPRLIVPQCGNKGHIARNCTEAGPAAGGRPYGSGFGGGYQSGGGYGAQGKTCYSCGGYGHMSRKDISSSDGYVFFADLI